MLTHEKSVYAEQAPYLASKWYPMPVLNLYGRCATLDPVVDHDMAVWFGWRDHIIPFILSKGFDKDTLFIVAEEDWRLTKEDADVEVEELAIVLVDTYPDSLF